MKPTWRTLWQLNDIVVYRNDVEVDRLPAGRIARVLLVHRGRGDNPGDIDQCVVELAGDEGYALFEPGTGFAGRVNFERHAFWRERRCVYWVPAHAATLPWRLRFAVWRGEGASRAFRRLARDELAASIARWPVTSPETWDERKLRRIERNRPFGSARGAHA
jgi:hypothetical protein